MAPYGRATGDDSVQSLVRHMQFDQPNNPTTADVEGWLAARSGILTGWLAAAGYVTPVTQSAAKAALDHYANYGAASDAEAAQRSAGYSDDDEDRREVFFAAEFRRSEAWIKSGALTALGVPLLVTPPAEPRGSARIGQIVAGTAADPRLQGKGGLR